MNTVTATANANDNDRSGGISYGAKYDRDLSTTQIAARYRADIKAAIKTGALPKGLKLSVRSEYFAGGSAIRASVTACPAFRVMNPERVIADIEQPHVYKDRQHLIHTTEAIALLKTLESMLNAYNFDGSDSSVDYFHVNFYGHPNFAGKLESAEREEIREEYEANKGWTLPEVA
jgi:hypothetical protein